MIHLNDEIANTGRPEDERIILNPKVATGKKSQSFVPSSYEELYSHYVAGANSLTNQLIRKFVPYATPEEREDLAADVFVRLMEKQMLEKFDASKANFGGVIFFVTRTVCVNHLGKKSRNPIGNLSAGSLVETFEDGEFEPGTYSLEILFDGASPNREAQLDAETTLGKLFQFAQSCKEKAAQGGRERKRNESLLPLLEMLEQGCDAKECAMALGVTVSTVGNWTTFLRSAL